MKVNFKKLGLVLMSLVLLLGLVACGSNKQANTNQENNENQANNQGQVEDSAGPKTGVDAVGNIFEIPEDLTKVGITPLPWASVAWAIDGSTDRIVAVHPGAMTAYEGSLIEKIDPSYADLNDSLIGSDFGFNDEEILGAGIQAMIIWDHQEDERDRLIKMGITPVMVQNKSLEDLEASLKAVGQLFGHEERAQEMVDAFYEADEVLASYADQVAEAEKPRVMYLRDKDLKIQGADHFIGKSLEAVGVENIIGDGKSITMEEIIAQDPEIILMSNFDDFVPEDLYENRLDGQDWSNVTAIKNKQVYKMPLGVYRWDAPGVETPLMMMYLGKVIQPEVFADLNFKEKMEDFYKSIYNYEISQEDIDQTLKTEANLNSQPIKID